eukprot:935761-Rhodomonas_salina.1
MAAYSTHVCCMLTMPRAILPLNARERDDTPMHSNVGPPTLTCAGVSRSRADSVPDRRGAACAQGHHSAARRGARHGDAAP